MDITKITTANNDMPQETTKPWRRSSGFGLSTILNTSSQSSPSKSQDEEPLEPSTSEDQYKRITRSAGLSPTRTFQTEQTYSSPSTPVLTISASSTYFNPQAPQPSGGADHQQQPLGLEKEVSSNDTPNRKPATSSGSRKRDYAKASATDDDDIPIRGGRWSQEEHARFLEGYNLHGHKWKKVQQAVKTRSVTQVRTHAQKYLLKLNKMKVENKNHKVDVVSLNDKYLNRAKGQVKGESSDEEMPLSEHLSIEKREQGVMPPPNKAAKYLDPSMVAAASALCYLMHQNIAQDSVSTDPATIPSWNERGNHESYVMSSNPSYPYAVQGEGNRASQPYHVAYYDQTPGLRSN